MGKLFQSLKEAFRSTTEQPTGKQRSREERTSGGHSTEKEAEQVPPERVGEVVGHSSSG
jgi:hypothetical protein